MEMKNNRVAFEMYKVKVEYLVGYQEVSGCLICDVNIAENFRRETQFVADGHLMYYPAFITYSTVVSRDSVRILLLVAALNDLEIMGDGINNAFLSDPNLEKRCIKAEYEFGAEQEKRSLLVRALYDLKLVSAAFRSFMDKNINEISFKSCMVAPDI